MMTESPVDPALIEALAAAFPDRVVSGVSRRPYRYATSAALEELRVEFEEGGPVHMIRKDLAWDALLDRARGSKPRFLHEPRRELETWRRILGAAGIGPRCYAAVGGDGEGDSGPAWLLLEKVRGVELWQVAELAVWSEVAAWLGRFHARFEGQARQLRNANPHLLELGRAWFLIWHDRATATLVETSDPRAPALLAALQGYEAVIDRLTALPITLVHGEFYPSNVLVVLDGGDVGVFPVDWEMTGTGPGLLDLAALVGGWPADVRLRLATSYGEGSGTGPPAPADLDVCRLHLSLQWLAWSPGWSAPPEHRHDWLGEALTLASRVVV